MAKFPKGDMIFAGYLACISLAMIIKVADTSEDLCRSHNGIPSWALLLFQSAGVSILTIVKCETDRPVQGLITFAASFLIYLCGNLLGYQAVFCSMYREGEVSDIQDFYSFMSLPVMAFASLGIMLHYMIYVDPRATRIPDPEVLLLGICVQFTVAYGIVITGAQDHFCKTGGVGSWLQLLTLSALLAVLAFMKTSGNITSKAPRALLTFIGSFLVHLILAGNGTGRFALECAMQSDLSTDGYAYTVLVLNAVLALAITTIYLIKGPSQKQIAAV